MQYELFDVAIQVMSSNPIDTFRGSGWNWK